MRRSEAKELLSGGQNSEVAFATEKVTNVALAKILIALANGNGGTLLLGANQAGAVRGVQDVDALCDRVLWAALSITPPLVLPLPERITADWGPDAERTPSASHTLVAVHVPPGLPSAYALNGRYLIRDGSNNRLLKAPEVHRLMQHRGVAAAPGQFETRVLPGVTGDDLDWDRVREYANRLEQPTPRRTSPEEMLKQRACLVERDGQYLPTAAGLLLFGRNPSLWVPSAEITAVRYPGTEMGDQFVREDITGPLPDQIRKAEAFLRANVPQETRLEGLTHEDRPAYPDQVLREVVVNAVAHRDYAIRGENIQVFIFKDRVRVYSPGRLPGHVTVENIVEERFSRNPVIVQVLADMGFIERLGYGIDRMLFLLKQAEQPVPTFQETAAGFKVLLHPRIEAAAATAKAKQEMVDPARWAHLELNARQKLAMRYIVEQGGSGTARLTNRAYQKLCPDVSAETIRRDLADMVHKGILIRIGRKRATYYILRDASLTKA